PPCPPPSLPSTPPFRPANAPGLGPARRACLGGVEVHYPRYYYPPKVLRNHYGWFLWQSVRRTVRRVLESGRPDVVLGYWAHPDRSEEHTSELQSPDHLV